MSVPSTSSPLTPCTDFFVLFSPFFFLSRRRKKQKENMLCGVVGGARAFGPEK
jgi:hypothetical protein